MQWLVIHLTVSIAATSLSEVSHPAKIAIFGDSAFARSELRQHCVIFPTFNPLWIGKNQPAASFDKHLHVSELPRDWQRFGSCDVDGSLANSRPVFDWVVDAVTGRVFHRADDGKLALFSTRKWLKDEDPAVRGSFLAELVNAERDAELFPCVGGCQAFQVRWARDPTREPARAAIDRILSLLGLPRQSEEVLVNTYLGEDVVIGKDLSFSFSGDRWFVHNLARTGALPLADSADFFFFSHPDGCKLTTPSASVNAWETSNGWLVHWKQRPPIWSIPFKAVAESPKEQCSIKNETVYVYLPTTLTGRPSVKGDLRLLIDVLQHRPMASLWISARQRIVLRHTQRSGWTEERRDIEVRFPSSLIEPPDVCSLDDSADESYHCPLSLKLDDFKGFVRWYE